jgi:hypothetical protein
MYKCHTCKATVPDGEPRLTYTVMVVSSVGTVARELPVCRLCRDVLLRTPPQVPPTFVSGEDPSPVNTPLSGGGATNTTDNTN